MTSIYNQTIKLFGSQPEPAFESSEQQTTVWGRQWGCDNDVGQIRLCLMHRPGDEMNIIDPAMRIAELVRRISGQNVYEFSRDHVFGPLGMNESGYLPPEPLPCLETFNPRCIRALGDNK